MRWLAVLLIVGCGPRLVGPPALLRRNHTTGDVLRVCERGDGAVFVAGMEPITMTMRTISDEHTLEARPRRFALRSDTVSLSVRWSKGQDEPAFLREGHHSGHPYEIDERNRRIAKKPAINPAAEPSETNQASLSALPYAFDIIAVTYPARPIRENETFPLRVRRSVDREDAIASDLAIDATFTVTSVDPDFIWLSCVGKQKEEARRDKEFMRVDLALTCRARIDRRNGRSARWWIDSHGTFVQSGEKYPLQARAHYDIAIGDVDPVVCERAAEP